MRNYSYKNKWKMLLTPEVVSLLTQIHEYKGEQTLLIEAKGGTLMQLVETAKMQSSAASNKIEGIYTSDERLKNIVFDKTTPRTRDEQEIAGYRDVLLTIRENYDFLPAKPSILLQLHRDLYKFSGKAIGGVYRGADDAITEEGQESPFAYRQPAPTWEIPSAIDAICEAFDEISAQADADPLLIIPMFVLDFLCIYPFSDGNGRMSRLLTLLLLYRAGYVVGKYISIEKIIEQTKETYDEALQNSSANWHEEKNDYTPFVQYTLGVVVAAYCEFSKRAKRLATSNVPKPERVRAIIKDTLGKITKTEIMEKCPDISQVTVQRALNELVTSGEILKIGGGRYTAYIWNRENEK